MGSGGGGVATQVANAGIAEQFAPYVEGVLADVKAKIMESSAVTMAASAHMKLNAAIAANPIGAIIIAIILLVVALVALERKFGLVTKSVEMLGQIFEILSNKVDKVLDSIKGVTSAAAELGDALAFGPISGLMNVLGGR